MAKVKNCPFCGKEIKVGFLGIFGGDAKELEFGDVSSIYVCADCDQKHHQFVANLPLSILLTVLRLCL